MQFRGHRLRTDFDHVEQVILDLRSCWFGGGNHPDPAFDVVVKLIEKPGDSRHPVEIAFSRLPIEFALQGSSKFTLTSVVH
jgi:hypothetical protein